MKTKRKTSSFNIDDITRDEVKKLAHILFLDTNDPQDRDAATGLIANLSAHLRRSKLLSLLIDKLGLLPDPTSMACELHKPLNRSLTRSIHHLIRAEVSTRLDGLASSQSKLSTDQRCVVQSLRATNGLWMSKIEFERKYLLPPSFTWHRQLDGCEACIIGRVVRDRLVLTNLRTVLLSRLSRRTTRRPPRLIRWVEEFMNCHGPTSLEMFMRSGEESVSLKNVRVEIKEGHMRGYNPRTSRVSEAMIDNDDGDDNIQRQSGTTVSCTESGYGVQEDVENEIIDSYADYMSAEYRHLENLQRTTSDKWDFDLEYNLEPSPHDDKKRTSEVRYFDMSDTPMTDVGRTNDGNVMRSHTTKTSKEYAREYRNLLGVNLRAPCYSPSNYTQGEKRPVSEALTSWSMLYSGVEEPIREENIPPLKICKGKNR